MAADRICNPSKMIEKKEEVFWAPSVHYGYFLLSDL
jgi:hypothetical protein